MMKKKQLLPGSPLHSLCNPMITCSECFFDPFSFQPFFAGVFFYLNFNFFIVLCQVFFLFILFFIFSILFFSRCGPLTGPSSAYPPITAREHLENRWWVKNDPGSCFCFLLLEKPLLTIRENPRVKAAFGSRLQSRGEEQSGSPTHSKTGDPVQMKRWTDDYLTCDVTS